MVELRSSAAHPHSACPFSLRSVEPAISHDALLLLASASIPNARQSDRLDVREWFSSNHRRARGALNQIFRLSDVGSSGLSARENVDEIHSEMGRPTGFEPATPRITILCSNQLSYGRRVEPGKLAAAPDAVNPFFRSRLSAQARLHSMVASACRASVS